MIPWEVIYNAALWLMVLLASLFDAPAWFVCLLAGSGLGYGVADVQHAFRCKGGRCP